MTHNASKPSSVSTSQGHTMYPPKLTPIALALALLTLSSTAWAGKTEEGHGCTTVRPYVESSGRCWHSYKEDGDKPKVEDKTEHKKSSEMSKEEKESVKLAKLDDCKTSKSSYIELKSIFKQEAEFDKDCKEHAEHGHSDRLACVKAKRDDKDKKDHEDEDKKFEDHKKEFDDAKKSHDSKKSEHDKDVGDHEKVKQNEADKESKAENSCKNKSGDDKDKCKKDEKKKYDDSDSSEAKILKEHDNNFESRDAEFKMLDDEYKVKEKKFDDEKKKHDDAVAKREKEKEHSHELRSKHEESCKDEHDDKKHERCVVEQRVTALKAVAEDITNSCAGSTHKPVGGVLPEPTSSGSESGGSKPTPVPLKSRESRQIFMR